MVTARDVMTPSTAALSESDSAAAAAGALRNLDESAVPVCDSAGRLSGVVTDRDIVSCLAAGWDPYATSIRELLAGDSLTVAADDPLESALISMAVHRVHRLPVVDDGILVGTIADTDIALALPDDALGLLLARRDV